jgi:hypothetical protein
MSLLARIFSNERPPAEALAGLDTEERVTAWARVGDDEIAVATPRGLWLGAGAARRRLTWDGIHKATWREGVLVLLPGVEIEPGVVADGPPITVQLPEPRDLPAEVRSRVTRSVAYSTHHTLPGGGVRIIARRVPGVDGLTWVLRFDDGTDRADPEVRHSAAELLEAARALADVPH